MVVVDCDTDSDQWLPATFKGHRRPAVVLRPLYRAIGDLAILSRAASMAATPLVPGSCNDRVVLGEEPSGKRTPEEKEPFFGAVASTGASRRTQWTGLNRDICYRWIQKAGLAPIRNRRLGREEFRKLPYEVLSLRVAARELEIHKATAEGWTPGDQKDQERTDLG